MLWDLAGLEDFPDRPGWAMFPLCPPIDPRVHPTIILTPLNVNVCPHRVFLEGSTMLKRPASWVHTWAGSEQVGANFGAE